MRVDIDEARGDDASGSIDFHPPGSKDVTYRRDAIAVDRYVAGERLRSGAIDNAAATNDEIELSSHVETSPREKGTRVYVPSSPLAVLRGRAGFEHRLHRLRHQPY